ncbi:SAGA-associated factor 11 homolog [Asparagus officinalis]|uniref:SAGA-associated factor 11 homolog n=1 Tax=Asparagus officinalis TaxID=4686 RepID=UPI00098E44B2|nr:SAGA-associated factor 11 homolog [Asparagus officinalis]
MSAANDGSSSPRSQLASNVFGELLDSIIVDMASECHRIARLGLDHCLDNEEEEMRLSMEARAADPSSSEASSKNVEDIFGQTHPAIASEIFDCMNCGRPIVAGRFAPHLEKCMGKGRKARQKTTRSTTMAQTRNSRASPVSVYAPYSNTTATTRTRNGSSSSAAEYANNYTFDGP